MIGFLSGDHWGVSRQWEVDTRIGNQVGLEFSQVNIQGTIESQRGGDGRDNLSNKAVQVGVGWPFNVEVSAANVVNGFVVDHESTIGVFKGGVGSQNGVVGLNNSSGNLKNKIIKRSENSCHQRKCGNNCDRNGHKLENKGE